jgi:GAF domain-containing protein
VSNLQHEFEAERVAELYSLGILDTASDYNLDRIIFTAAQVAAVPIALISLVDRFRQFFKAKVGISISETSRDYSFCAYAIEQSGMFTVRDARAHHIFCENPLVTGSPGIRFYAGIPLLSSKRLPIGTLCVIDKVPRELDDRQIQALFSLARKAERLIFDVHHRQLREDRFE